MQETAFVTGADRGLGLAFCSGLLERKWRVFAGQFLPEWYELSELADRYPDLLDIVPLDVASIESALSAAQAVASQVDHIDMLINNAGVNTQTKERKISEPQDYDEYQRLYNINAVGPIRVVEAFLPLMEQGNLKRLCFVSSEAGSIARCYRVSWYAYTMSKAALNRGVKVMFNQLRPEGFTFRVYHPGWVQSYIGGTKNIEADLTPEESAQAGLELFINPLPDEDHLSMLDWQGEEWPW
jgi:NAD(P)-dependent dehydrogenase (short-subunit alcohol dehydrogenase family)